MKGLGGVRGVLKSWEGGGGAVQMYSPLFSAEDCAGAMQLSLDRSSGEEA